MKKGILMLLLGFSIIGCSKKVYDTHTAATSLDYKGSYYGVLPCADCEGIETVLTLSDESKYTLIRKYLGKEVKEIKSEGTFSFNKEGNTISLKNEKNTANQYFVSENKLTALDVKGNKITGNLAEKYELKKNSSQKGSTKSQGINNIAFAGENYKLVQMEGMFIVQGERVCSVRFEKSDKFTAFAGCNNIMGQYLVSKEVNGIKFSNVAATKKACPDMNTEQQFLKCLSEVTLYSMDDTTLYLIKPDGKIVLQFEKM